MNIAVEKINLKAGEVYRKLLCETIIINTGNGTVIIDAGSVPPRVIQHYVVVVQIIVS